MAGNYGYVAVFAIVGVAFAVISLVMSWFLRPHNPSGEKLATYECGEVPVGPAWRQFRVGYYIYLLAFVIFDVEVLFVIPWALALRNLKGQGLGLFAVVDGAIFIAVLAAGLLYAWKKGALKWE
ncbi:MAG: NADH-quinone oxidoreductase subunit A [Armatimonadota bacterium]|nr:NADH-quinone oxidoreductase subunit A [Armatimonadota bacterium]